MEGANLEYHATSFRIFLYTALVAGIGMNVNTVYSMLHIPTSSDLLRSAILEMLFICVQACIAAIFLYHGVMFIVHRRHAREGGQTEQTLLMLSYLALIGCASFVFTIMANKIAMNPAMFSVPGGYLMLWLFRTLGSTIRIAALLLIMSVRPPAMSRLSRAGSVRSMMTIKSTASTLVGGPETTKVSSWLSKRSEQRDKTDQS
jgi:membrane-associated HD superfamily phosphohydrolase